MKIKVKEKFVDSISGKKIYASKAENTTNGLNIDDSISSLSSTIKTKQDKLTFSGEDNTITAINTSAFGIDLSNYYTKSETSGANEISAALEEKQDKVFVAEYGVTTYAEIKDAYDAGKQIICKYVQNEAQTKYLSLTQFVKPSNLFIFCSWATYGEEIYVQFTLNLDGTTGYQVINECYYTQNETSARNELTDAFNTKQNVIQSKKNSSLPYLETSNSEPSWEVIESEQINAHGTAQEGEVYNTTINGRAYTMVCLNGKLWLAENYVDSTKASYTDSKYGSYFTERTIKSANFVPQGWHLPTKEEYQELIDAETEHCEKYLATTDWHTLDYQGNPDPNYIEGTNELKLNILPGGSYNEYDGTLNQEHYLTYFWTSTDETSTQSTGKQRVYAQISNYIGDGISKIISFDAVGPGSNRYYTVRLIKDDLDVSGPDCWKTFKGKNFMAIADNEGNTFKDFYLKKVEAQATYQPIGRYASSAGVETLNTYYALTTTGWKDIAEGFYDKTTINNSLSLKQDNLSFAGENNTITSINNSAIGCGSVGGVGGAYVPLSAVECTIGSGNSSENCSFAQGIGNSAIQYSLAQGTSNFSYNKSVSFGSNNSAFTNSFVLGDNNNSNNNSLVLGSYTSAADNSVAFGSRLTANGYSFNFGDYNLAENYSQTFGCGLKATSCASANGYDDAVITYGSFVIGKFNKTSAAPFVIGNGTSDNDRRDLFVIDKDGNVSAQGQIYAKGGVLGASLDTLELAPDNETIVFETTSSHNVENSEGEPEEYTVIKIAPSLLEKINKLEKLVSANSGNSQWVLPQ